MLRLSGNGGGLSRWSARLSRESRLQAQTAHQSLDRAGSHLNTFALELLPNLDGTIDLLVGVPDACDLRQQQRIALFPTTAQLRVATSGHAASIGRRDDHKDFRSNSRLERQQRHTTLLTQTSPTCRIRAHADQYLLYVSPQRSCPLLAIPRSRAQPGCQGSQGSLSGGRVRVSLVTG